jgi:Ca-activated chloride channel homolog
MANPSSETNHREAVHVTLVTRPDQHLIPRAESFRHLDLLVRAASHPPVASSEREPLTLALVLDRSGSMSGAKIETAKRAALAMLERLDERDTVAVVVFDDQIDVLQAAARVTPAVKQQVRTQLQDVGARASTALHEGWLTGCKAIASEELTPPERGVARCFLLTDGLANVGLTDPEQIAAQAADIRLRAGIGTSTFGVGDDYAEELLSPMSEAGGGRFHNLRTAGEIASTFVGELGELLATVASNVTLELEVEPGVIVEVVSTFWATPAPDDPARWMISLGELFGGEERHAVVRLGFQDHPHREEQAVRVRVHWTAQGREHTSSWVEEHFTYADEATVAAEHVDATVLEVAGQHLADRTHREALRRSKSGDVAGAVGMIRASSAMLARYAMAAPSLAPEVAEMDLMQAEIAEGPILSARSKELYYQRQARTQGKRDLRGAAAPTPPPAATGPAAPQPAPRAQAERLLAKYIKSSVAWPQALPNALPEELVRDRMRGCLLWGAVGDALGRPLEGLTAEEIRSRYGPEGLTRFLPPLDWRSGPKGTWTGTTALTIELARSLVASDGHLRPEDFAQRLAHWQPNGRPVDRTTEHARQILAAGTPWWQTQQHGDANPGAAVRVAPVGLAHAFDANPLALRQEAVLSALVTHADAPSVAGAVALAAGVAWLLREAARGADAVDAVAFIQFVTAAIAGMEPPASGDLPRLAKRLRELPTALATPEQAFERLDNGTSVYDAVPAACFCFLRSPNDPRQVVLQAANLGTMASSVASMAGQLAGAWIGGERLWRDATPWWDELEARDELRGLADQVAALTLKDARR